MIDEFEAIFEECVEQVTSGESCVEECLARYPQFEAQLEPLLYSIVLLQDKAQAIRPSPFLRAQLRSELNQAIEKSQRPRERMPFLFGRMALNLAVLMVALVMTNTLFAQKALPGEELYDWKLASENFWRSVTTDPLGTDLKISERRIDEYVAVSSDDARRQEVLLGYNKLLVRFKEEKDESDRARILNVLKAQRDALRRMGLTIPELDSYFSGGWE
jgi:hypothetical protein